jgi:hypothetical protein
MDFKYALIFFSSFNGCFLYSIFILFLSQLKQFIDIYLNKDFYNENVLINHLLDTKVNENFRNQF